LSSPVSGSFGERTKKFLDAIKAHPQGARFASMTNIDYKGIGEPDYGKRVAAQLEQDIKNGAIGLKVWKNFGMREKDIDGKRVPVDDPRLDPVWDVCAKYKIPVMIHTADPKPLFDPMDKYNERWLELRLRPNRAEAGQDFTWEQVIGEQHNLFAKHPKTIFIAAHMGWMAHDLQALGAMLDRMPNLNVEIAAILGELGRQPRNAKRFFIKYQDRILFGKDTYNVSEYPFYFRVLETDDDWIDNIRKYHGLWKLYGLDLPDDVLKKVYYKNALRLFPSLSSVGFPK
jgi:predicted TIM-barrel fold metal-dependent hydrolase